MKRKRHLENIKNTDSKTRKIIRANEKLNNDVSQMDNYRDGVDSLLLTQQPRNDNLDEAENSLILTQELNKDFSTRNGNQNLTQINFNQQVIQADESNVVSALMHSQKQFLAFNMTMQEKLLKQHVQFQAQLFKYLRS